LKDCEELKDQGFIKKVEYDELLLRLNGENFLKSFDVIKELEGADGNTF